MKTLFRITPLALFVAAQPVQVPSNARNEGARIEPSRARAAQSSMLYKVNLLPPGPTLGTFHLNGMVLPNKTVVLRWANTHGEMPTEGVTVYRMKVGEKKEKWEALNAGHPVAFFRNSRIKDQLKAIPEPDRNRLLSLFHGDLQYDPATKLRMVKQPSAAPGTKLKDLTPEKVAEKYLELRTAGKLAKSDMQMLHSRADMDPSAAALFGLSYIDTPPKGTWRYKIAVRLREGKTVEAQCDKIFDPSVPTPVPSAVNLTAQSGNGSVLLNWEAPPSDIITGYRIYRSETQNGPWKPLTPTPVKLVKIESEDPEANMQRALAHEASLEREMKRNTGMPMTEQKVRDMRLQAIETASAAGALPGLSPALSKSIKEGVASGRLISPGLKPPTSAYTDTRKAEGNSDLYDEHTYYYRITTVDIAGNETPKEKAPLIAGTPKDLTPPQVPGKPMLKAESEALNILKGAQGNRFKNSRIKEVDQALASKLPMTERALTPFLKADGSPVPASTTTPPAAPPDLTSASLAELKMMRKSQWLTTMPIKETAAAAKASLLYSNADGSAPTATLVWAPSPDSDLKSYEIYRSNGDGPLKKMATTTAPTWTDNALEVGQAYRYAISAVDQRGNESELSALGRIEVCDSQLKQKLAISSATGKVSTAVPAGVSVRSMLRPAGRKMKFGDMGVLKSHSAVVQMPATFSAAKMGTFRAPKNAAVPRVSHVKGLTSTDAPVENAKPVTVKTMAAKTADMGSLKSGMAIKFAPKIRASDINVMMVEPEHPKEIHVLLEWTRPAGTTPTEYVVYQAPQKFELKASARPNLKVTSAFTNFAGMHASFGGASRHARTVDAADSGRSSSAASTKAVGSPLTMSTDARVGTSAGKSSTAAQITGAKMADAGVASSERITSTPELHALASKGIVALGDLGLKEATPRKDQLTSLMLQMGPGEFTRVSDTQVVTERYAITFPADVAQFGGTTFYYRIQARTMEFGRLVEGPMSEPIEVKLPDVVPPGAPQTGASNIQEVNAETFNVNLTWSHVPAPDYAGCFVDRQTFNYTVVDGEAKPSTPIGDPMRLTKKPTDADSFVDADAPGGYQRYTIRSVDKTGNISEPKGYMDLWVPGEPHPLPPTGLAIAGNRVTWKPSTFAQGYTVWRSFSGNDGDYEQISGLLGASETGYNLPAKGSFHLKVVARSTTGMHQAASGAIMRTAIEKTGNAE
jgi:hypothetical protein